MTRWVGFSLNKWKKRKLWQIREEAVCPSRETDTQSEERKEKWEKEKKDYSASKHRTSLLTPLNKENFFITSMCQSINQHSDSGQGTVKITWLSYLPFSWNLFLFISLPHTWPSWLGLQNILTASLQRGKTPQ